MPAAVSPALRLTSGDFDGDGYADLAVGIPRKRIASGSGTVSAGEVNVLYGGGTGLSASRSQVWSQNSVGIKGAAEKDDHFGDELASGDFDGDGRDDLAVGAADDDVQGKVDGGAVNVIYGSVSGLAAAGDQIWTEASSGVKGKLEKSDYFGHDLFAARFNSGDRWDLAIGIPGEDLPGAKDAGAVDVLYGASSGLSAASSDLWTRATSGIKGQPQVGAEFGYTLH